MNKLSLQWRITLSTAVILLICTATLTFTSLKSAGNSFTLLAEEMTPLVKIAQPQEELIEAQPLVPSTHNVAQKTSIALKKAEHHFGYSSFLFCTVVTLLGGIITYFIAGYSLKPLRELNTSIANMSDENLSARLKTRNSKDELDILTSDFNDMLSRLEDAFTRQRQFVANAAHELKTPLASIKTSSEVINACAEASISDMKDVNAQNVHTVDCMNDIIEDLLLLVKSESSGTCSVESIDLQSLIESIHDEVYPLLQEKNISFINETEDLTISTNFAFLYRAILNLVENAIKYGRHNGNIYISSENDTKDIFISVRDDGIGIKDENLPYLFDAFYRVDNSRSRKTGGSGLGLSIVKSALSACGGTISVKSLVNIGSEFTIKLPK